MLFYKNMIKSIIEYSVKVLPISPSEIWLFSSCARCTIKNGSDIDSMFVYNTRAVSRAIRDSHSIRGDIDEYSWSLSS